MDFYWSVAPSFDAAAFDATLRRYLRPRSSLATLPFGFGAMPTARDYDPPALALTKAQEGKDHLA